MNGPLVVVGDVLLDTDVVGTSTRLCPDTPVPVVEQIGEHPRPGGAGLAALLAAARGAEVVLVTAMTDDMPGRRLRALLESHVEVAAIRSRGGTPCKIRIQAEGQPVVRLDTGAGHAADMPVGPRINEALSAAGAVLVSDYGRGMTANSEVRALLEAASRRVPVVWDPHPRGTAPVPGTTVLTPNEQETAALAESDPGGHGLGGAARRARHLADRWKLDAVAVTLGAQGALLHRRGAVPLLAPAGQACAGDTCGAGDCFASAVTCALADGAGLPDAVSAGVRRACDFVTTGGAGAIAAGLADRRGAQATSPSGVDAFEVIERTHGSSGTVVATGGCFDVLHAGHVNLLRQARRLGDCLVVCVNSDESVQRRKGPRRPATPVHDRVRILEALADVDAVAVFDEDTPEPLLRRLRPDIWVKGGDYAGETLRETRTVRDYGGEVVLLPYLEGRSSTRMLAAVPNLEDTS